jgi:acyl-CoA synthetase (NDP forming)
VLGSSGGAASLTSDLAHRHGMPLARYAPATEKAIGDIVPRSGTVGNPLDLSGGNVDAASVFSIVADDDGVGLLLLILPAPFPDDSTDRAAHRNYMERAAEVSDRTGVPLVIASVSPQAVPEWTRRLCDRHQRTRVVQGMATTTAALAALLAGRGTENTADGVVTEAGEAASAALSEAEGRRLLSAIDFPVVPGRECDELAGVVDAAAEVGFPLAAKGILPGVAHKAAIGGVVLGVCDADAAAAACEAIATRCVAAGTEPQGFLLEEMVSGTELLVGLTRDPVYGPAITIGLGGALAETALGQATAVLPLDGDTAVIELLEEAGIAGVVARSAAGTGLFERHVRTLAEAFVSGPLVRYATVEINPLFLTPDGRMLAGDVLVQPLSS